MKEEDNDLLLLTSEVDLPTTSKRRGGSQNDKKKLNPENLHEWTENLKRLPSRPFYLPADNLTIKTKNFKIIDFFETFCTEEINTYFTVLTNKKIVKKRKNMCLITELEMRKYMGISIAMGLVKTSNYKNYWNVNSKLFFSETISNIMSLKRFSEINSNITCISDKDYHETTRKIINEPKIVKFFNKNTRNKLLPEECISIDESTIPFKGNVAFKVFNPNKPDKHGIKIYMCSYSRSSYIYSVKVCSLSSTIKNTVFNLLSGLEGRWHKIFMDNFYNSFDLCRDLLAKEFNVCGTLRLNRGGPRDLNDIKRDLKVSNLKVLQRGDINVFLYKEKASKKAVSLISTFHNIEYQNQMSNPKKTYGKQKLTEQAIILNECITVEDALERPSLKITSEHLQNVKDNIKYDVHRPQCIVDYNKNMGGVDLTDQMMKNYTVLRKNNRWVNKMTLFVVQCCLHNGYILYCKDRKRPLSQSEFREEVFYSIVKYDNVKRKPSTEKQLIFKKHLITKLEKRRRCDNKEYHVYLKTNVCLTSWFCKDCDKSYCFPACYNNYHENHESIYNSAVIDQVEDTESDYPSSSY
ncbi:PiggyBac transposable element-derived protein 4 [Cucumispora dikerogammari]|nr:PiggyBac transposable element-derived protein 4 [Cucumispora dikerogammari]